MEMNFDNKTAAEKIKTLAAYRNFSIPELCSKFNQQFGTNYSANSFARKLRNNAISFAEMEQFGKILGFSVKLELTY